MAARTIAIRITLDNRDALNATKAQILLTREMNKEVDKHTHLQNGLTNSFIKGNLAARGISVAYGLVKEALVSLISTSVQFEYTMAKIEAVSGGSSLSMKSLEGTIRSLSLSTNQSQVEIAKTALEMGKMGLSSYQVEKALGGVVKLSKALDEGLVKTGETVVGVMNAYNMSASEINKITNQLAFTVKESALDMEKFGIAFSYAGGTAAEAGVSFEELQGAMDILSNSGIRASTIGTSLRRIISDLSDENSLASKAAGGTIESYGGLANVLDALKQKNLETSDYTAIFGRTATSVAAIVTKYSGIMADLAKQTGEVGNLVDPMSDKMNNTLLGSLNGITTAWKDLGIEISKSTGFLSTFAQFIDKVLTGVGKSFQRESVLEEFKKRRPEAFEKDRQAIYEKASVAGAPIRFARTIASGSPVADREVMQEGKYFQRFELEFPKILKKEQDKQNSTELLQGALGKQKLPAGWSPDKFRANQIKINPEDTAMYAYIQNLWGTDDKGFKSVWDKAVLNWAMKADASKIGDPEFDRDSLSERGSKKKPLSLVKANAISDDEIKSFAAGLAAEDPNIGAAKTQDFTKGAKEASEDKQKYQALADKIIKNAGRYGKRDKLGDESNEKLEILKEEQSQELALLTEHGINVAEVRKAQERELSDYIIQLHRQERESKLAISADFVGSMGQLMTQLAGKNRALAIAGKALASGEVILNTAVAVSKVWGQTGIFGFAAQAAPILSGAAQLAAINAIHFASGTDQVVTKPTMFMAGESGKERVTVTPRAKMSSDRSGGGITVNIQGDVLDGAKFTEAVEMAQKRLRRRLV